MGMIFESEDEAERIVALLMGHLSSLGFFDPTDEEAAHPEIDLRDRVMERLASGAKDDGSMAFTIWQNVERRTLDLEQAQAQRWTHTCRPRTHGAHSPASASECNPCRMLVEMGLIDEMIGAARVKGATR